MERDGKRVCRREEHTEDVRGAGGEEGGGSGGGERRAEDELWGAEPASKPAGKVSAAVGGKGGEPGGALCRAGSGDDGGGVGDFEERRGVRARGSELSGRGGGLQGGGCRGEGGGGG